MATRLGYRVGRIYTTLENITQQYMALQTKAEQARNSLPHNMTAGASLNAQTLANISIMAQKSVTNIPYEAVEISNQYISGGAKMALENYFNSHLQKLKEAEETINQIKKHL